MSIQALQSMAMGDDTVKDGMWAGTGTSIYTYESDKDVFDGNQGDGQGNNEPPNNFNIHHVVSYGGKIYDPSYGLGPFNTENDHENAVSAGVFLAPFVKKNDENQQELKYTAM